MTRIIHVLVSIEALTGYEPVALQVLQRTYSEVTGFRFCQQFAALICAVRTLWDESVRTLLSFLFTRRCYLRILNEEKQN
jgi:hypothetical protein